MKMTSFTVDNIAPTLYKTGASFKQETTSKVFIADAKANHLESMKLLEDNGLRPLKTQEIFFLINRNPKLLEQLTGKRFWLANVGSYYDGDGYKSFDKNGRITPDKHTNGKREAEKTIYIRQGRNPLSLNIYPDAVSLYLEGRFCLDATNEPEFLVPAVVGVIKDRKIVIPKPGVARARCITVADLRTLASNAQQELGMKADLRKLPRTQHLLFVIKRRHIETE